MAVVDALLVGYPAMAVVGGVMLGSYVGVGGHVCPEAVGAPRSAVVKTRVTPIALGRIACAFLS
jgi:hypothetical protein